MTTLPGSLVSPVAGPILCRCAPVFVDRFRDVPCVVLREKRDGHVLVGYPWRINDEESDVWPPSRLTLDLSDPTGRDIAIRWGVRHDIAIHDAKEASIYAQCSADTLEIVGDSRRRMLVRDHRDIAERWHALRDNPEALALACLAAGEVR